jgi:GT2 family glycosyltransferase
MRTLIVIVNYRTPNLTIECLRSPSTEVVKSPRTQVVVVDNASRMTPFRDCARPSVPCPRPVVSLAPHASERWLRAGNNAGISWANARRERSAVGFDLVWLLNPDTVVLEGALQSLERHMRENPSVGIGAARS